MHSNESDSTFETEHHIGLVNKYISTFVNELTRRGMVHDDSKLEEPEKAAWDGLRKVTGPASEMDYGSKEYYDSMNGYLAEALKHHYANNSHHPEYYEMSDSEQKELCEEYCQSPAPVVYDDQYKILNTTGDMINHNGKYQKGEGINGMDLFDLIEMYCDWLAASEKFKNKAKFRMSHNSKRFNMGEVLTRIFENTLTRTGRDWE